MKGPRPLLMLFSGVHQLRILVNAAEGRLAGLHLGLPVISVLVVPVSGFAGATGVDFGFPRGVSCLTSCPCR